MFKAARQLIREKPWYLVVYFLILVLLAASSWMEYRSRYWELLELIQDQAATTAAVIAQSGTGQVYLATELEAAYVDHAYDLLSLIETAERNYSLSAQQLYALFSENSLLDLFIYDAAGNLVTAELARSEEGVRASSAAPDRDLMKPLLQGDRPYIVRGLERRPKIARRDTAGIDRREPFMVGIPRANGGALAIQLSTADELEFRSLTALDGALENLISIKGMEYLTLSMNDHESYAVAKSSISIDSTWTRSAVEDILYLMQKKDQRFLEIVRPVFFESGIGEVRMGFKAETFFNLRGQIIYEVILRTTLLTVLALVTLVWLISRQNAAYLMIEKQRIEAEVQRLEKLNMLREKQAAMGELAAGVAHEIRNPLNAIGIAAQRLKREFVPETESVEYAALTTSMVSEIKRINHSLQEFLNYTKPTSLNILTIQTSRFLEEVIKLHESLALEKNISLSFEGQTFSFEADPVYLKQAVSNLVLNALEACGPGDTIKLSTRRQADRVLLGVADTGAGIPEKDQHRLFDLYFSTKDMGTGVGLALTHKIIADHGGFIEVRSTLGIGSYFELNLPVKQ